MAALRARDERARRGPLHVAPEEEDELRAFCSLVARRTPRSGELAWALRRYELGCERAASPRDALTDHLLALRALLEPEGPQSGRLAGRLAALCAPARAARRARRARRARGRARAHGRGRAAPRTPALGALAGELAGHLRALLRDVLCGHLDPDLRAIADALLAEDEDAAVPAG